MTRLSSVLLVVGDEPVMRQTFREHGRAYLSTEFWLVLEEHGGLDVEVTGPQALEDAAGLAQRAVVIVGGLPDDAWRPEYVASLRAYEGVLLLEGPFPAEVEAMLEIKRCGESVVGLRGALGLVPALGRDLSPGGGQRVLRLATSPSTQQSRALSGMPPAPLQASPLGRSAARAALASVLDYGGRFLADGRFFDNPVQDALALLACIRYLAGVSHGHVHDQVHDELRQLVRDAAGSSHPPVAQSDAGSARGRAIRGVALAEAATVLEDWTFAERAKEIVGGVRSWWHLARSPDPELRRWQALLSLHLTELGGGCCSGPAVSLIEHFVPSAGDRPPPLLVWLDVELRSRLDGNGRSPSLPGEQWLSAAAAGLQASSGKLPGQLEGLTLPALMLLLGALRQAEHRSAARRLWRVLLDGGYEPDRGLFKAARVLEGRLVPTAGFARAPALALGLLSAARPVDFIDAPSQGLLPALRVQLPLEGSAPRTLIIQYRAWDEADAPATTPA